MLYPDRSNHPERKGLAEKFGASIGNDGNNQNSDPGQFDFPSGEKQSEKPLAFTQQNTYVSKANGAHLSDQKQLRGQMGAPNIRYERKNGEIYQLKIDRGSEGNKSDSGTNLNKTNINRAISAASNQGVVLLNQQPRILAGSLMVPVQVPLALVLESGQKLPVIILPNIGNPTGSRIERRKTRKEQKDEERKEKEDEGCSYLFGDGDPFESLDN